MADDQARWTYEQIAKQIEREDNLYQTRLSSCIVVNLALLAAVATQINLPGLGLKNLIIILGCSAAGYAITSGIRLAIANGSTQLANLRRCFGDLGLDPCSFPPPFMIDADPGRKNVFYRWTSITLVFQLMWLLIPFLALLAFLFPNIIA